MSRMSLGPSEISKWAQISKRQSPSPPQPPSKRRNLTSSTSASLPSSSQLPHSNMIIMREVGCLSPEHFRFRALACLRPHCTISFGAMRSAGQAACIGQDRNQLPSIRNRAKIAGLALVQDAALADGWVACSFTFQGFSIAAFRANESPLRIGADTFCFRAALFDVVRPRHDDGLSPRTVSPASGASMRIGHVWPILPHIREIVGRQLEYGQWLESGMLSIGCIDPGEKLISVSVIPDASMGNVPSASNRTSSSDVAFPYSSAFHFTIGGVLGIEHFSLRRSCGKGGRFIMCNGTGLLIIQPDITATASLSPAVSSAGIMFPYTLTAPCGGVRATWIDVFNQLSLHTSWPTHKTPSLKMLDMSCDLVSWKRPSTPGDSAPLFIVSVVVLCSRAPGAHISAGYSQPAAAAAAVELASRTQGVAGNGATCFVRCLCVAYDARDASIRFSKVWAEHEAPSHQTKIPSDERKRRLQKLREKNAAQLDDSAGSWQGFDMQPINASQPLPHLDSRNTPWRLKA